eukprot:gene11112-14914_t
MSTFSHYNVLPDIQVPVHNSSDTSTNPNLINDMLEKMKFNILKLNDEEIEFELIGVDSSVANALRRIMLAEVPTIAIEHVWIAHNGSILQDEMLAHRIGLVPIRADPHLLDYVVNEDETDRDTIVFHFDVECKNEIVQSQHPSHIGASYLNDVAYSGALTWAPQGNQLEVFTEGVEPVHKDIVIAKLTPGQRIEIEAHCRKGVGKDHTKFSPVATAFYKLKPQIKLKERIIGKLAKQLQ